MKVNIRLIKKKRVYSLEFKQELVRLFETGQYSVYQLQRLYGVRNTTIYSWIYKLSIFNESGQRIVEMKTSSTKKIKELEDKIKELERSVGRKQIQLDYFEKMIELAKTELNIDLKKNFNTPQSSGSDRIEKK